MQNPFNLKLDIVTENVKCQLRRSLNVFIAKTETVNLTTSSHSRNTTFLNFRSPYTT